jgi:predicted dehydrogenase
MEKILKWGIIGTAKINGAVIPPLQRSKRNQLWAVASRDADRAAAYAKEWGIPNSFGSYDALLADPDIDVVYVSLPNSLHAEWTIRAAQAGKHVLCEKPLAISLDEVDAITEAARVNGVQIAEAFMYRHHPQTLKVQEMVASGALGKIWLVRGSFSFQLNRPGDVRLSPDLLGGSLWDVGCYPVSYARTVLGVEPQEVYGAQATGPSGVDLSFSGMLRFGAGPHNGAGAMAQFDSGFVPAFRSVMEIVGDERSLTIPSPFKPVEGDDLVLKQGDSEEKIPVPAFDLYSGEIENMADAVLHGAAPRISLADSRANVAAILALYESARSRKPVMLA